jgi:hypothetical protein
MSAGYLVQNYFFSGGSLKMLSYLEHAHLFYIFIIKSCYTPGIASVMIRLSRTVALKQASDSSNGVVAQGRVISKRGEHRHFFSDYSGPKIISHTCTR